jgi:hypothetical protein
MLRPSGGPPVAPRGEPWPRATPVAWSSPARRPAAPTPQATPSASSRPRPTRHAKPKSPIGWPSHHAATAVGTSTARSAAQCTAAVQAARSCRSPRSDSQFVGTRARGNSSSTPVMNRNAFHFAGNPVARREAGRYPGAAGSWLGVSIMASGCMTVSRSVEADPAAAPCLSRHDSGSDQQSSRLAPCTNGCAAPRTAWRCWQVARYTSAQQEVQAHAHLRTPTRLGAA